MVSWICPAFFFLTLLLSTLTQASVTNYTIDDSSLDPRTGNSILYYPQNAWNSATSCHGSSNLSGCNAQPDKSKLYQGTWHEGTFYPDRDGYPPLVATVRFDGTAVYVYCALHGGLRNVSTDMSFIIDGRLVGKFRQSSPVKGYEYDILAFSTTSLSPGFHELEITNGTPGGPQSLIIFDRIVYSFDDGITIPPPPAQFQNGVSTSSTITQRPTPTTTYTPIDTVSTTQSTNATQSNSNTSTISIPTPIPPPFNLGQPAGTNSSATSSAAPTTSTSEASPPRATLSHSLQPGLIIGIALASVAALLILVIIFLLCRRRRRQAAITVSAGIPAKDGHSVNSSSAGDVDPFSVYAPASDPEQLRWVVASDSKRTLLERGSPPTYR